VKAKSKPGKGEQERSPHVLELVKEVKLADLLMGTMEGRHEASGVHHRDGLLYIVFDNYPNIACVSADLDPATAPPVLIRQRGERIGYEDITYQPREKRWYCLIEASEYKPDLIEPRIEEFDETFRYIEGRWLNFPVKSGNKGIEGLSCLRYRDQEYLLGLCEGNNCASGKEGRQPGKGRVLVFRRTENEWVHAGTVKLPKAVQFVDYSSLDLRDRYVTVVSQVSSAMWVGRVREQLESLDDVFEDDGHFFLFPRDKKGRPLYCTIEGVTWIGDRKLVVVSDRAKPGVQPAHCAEKDQSIHIFKLPDDFDQPSPRLANR
jgi:hypothetical protein